MKAKYDFRQHLGQVLESRLQRNSRYSLTAFARDLGVSPSTLSLILSQKRGLSLQKAEDIALKIGLNNSQKNIFIESVKKQSSRIVKARPANKEITEAQAPKIVIQPDFHFEITWRHCALRELIGLKNFKAEQSWLASKLHTTPTQAWKIWQECVKGQFIIQQQDGSYLANEHISITGQAGKSNDSLKKTYHDLLGHIADQVMTATPQERDLSMIMLSIAEDQYAELVQKVRLFASETSRNMKISEKKQRTQVICWSTQILKI